MQDFYPTYGRIKGQSWLRIVFAHALGPTLVPVIAYFGPLVAHTGGGLVVLKRIGEESTLRRVRSFKAFGEDFLDAVQARCDRGTG